MGGGYGYLRRGIERKNDSDARIVDNGSRRDVADNSIRDALTLR